MNFPFDDRYWLEVSSFLQQHSNSLEAIMAPNEFLDIFPGTYHYNVSYLIPVEHFAYVVFHKGMLDEIEYPFTLKVVQNFQAVFANEVFVIYAQNQTIELPKNQEQHLESFRIAFSQYKYQPNEELSSGRNCAITVTTYNRPHALRRSLAQILALGVSVIVVDDGSSPENYQLNLQIADKYQIPLIYSPTNRGLPYAMNFGISYWLADPHIEWISYFQDDVNVNPKTLEILSDIQDADKRPILTGVDAPEHPSLEYDLIAGHKVILKRSSPGIHLHAHRNYWIDVMPIPTPYLGAPKPDRGKIGQGADEDWWITAWSPQSIVKRGGYVVCIPGLVSTFCDPEESTWQNTSIA